LYSLTAHGPVILAYLWQVGLVVASCSLASCVVCAAQ